MTAKKAEMLTLTVSHSANVKANLGNYESSGAEKGETEIWNVEGLTEKAIEKLRAERKAALKERLDAEIVAEYQEMKGE